MWYKSQKTQLLPHQFNSCNLLWNPTNPTNPADNSEKWRVVHLHHRSHLQLALWCCPSILPNSVAAVWWPQCWRQVQQTVNVLQLRIREWRQAGGFGGRERRQGLAGGFLGWQRRWTQCLFGRGHQGYLGSGGRRRCWQGFSGRRYHRLQDGFVNLVKRIVATNFRL